MGLNTRILSSIICMLIVGAIPGNVAFASEGTEYAITVSKVLCLAYGYIALEEMIENSLEAWEKRSGMSHGWQKLGHQLAHSAIGSAYCLAAGEVIGH